MTDVPVEIGRAHQLFSFLKAFAEQRMPKQRTIAQQLWSLALKDLPVHPSIMVGQVLLSSSMSDDLTDGMSTEPLLRVTRPKLTNCPRPPASIKDYLNPGWEEPEATVDILPSINVELREGTATVHFNEDPERVAALESWKSARAAWTVAELPARKAMAVYSRLYTLRGQIELESEQVELILGDGRLRWNHAAGLIDHPILLQRVELEFDTDRNEFRVIDADRPPELYTAVLGSDDVSPEQYQSLREDLVKGGFHPLAGEATSGYLRRLAATLGPRSTFSEQRLGPPATTDATIGRDPFLILRTRPPGFAAAFDRILGDLESRSELPSALTRLVGIDNASVGEVPADGTPPWGEPPDVLLSKPANADQVKIAQVLERQRAVLVQGPPGTGKSHTIANLIGHLVAKGKRVLVTSHTTKALKVLRDEVVETLRPLCVSVLENDSEGRAQLEDSIRGILSRLTASSEDVLGQEVGDLSVRRLALNAEIGGIVKDLHTVRLAEYEAIIFGGESYEPDKAADWVRKNSDGNSWIPGPIVVGAPLPLSQEELVALYASSGQITREEVSELSGELPEAKVLLTPEQFEVAIAEARIVERPSLAAFWSGPASESALPGLEALDDCVRRTVSELDRLTPWQRAIVAVGHDGGTGPQTWVDFARMIEEAHGRWQSSRPVMLEYAVEKVPSGPVGELRKAAEEVHAHLVGGGALGFLTLLGKGHWKALIRGTVINGTQPATSSEFQALCVHFALEDGRARLATRWGRLCEPAGLPAFAQLTDTPEPMLMEFGQQFEGLLNWWTDHWTVIDEMAGKLGFRWDAFRAAAVAASSPLPPFERDALLLRGETQTAVSARTAAAKAQRAGRVLTKLGKALVPFAGPICRSLAASVTERDPGAYRNALQGLQALANKRLLSERRRATLTKLAASARPWAQAINRRVGEHGLVSVPGNSEMAWRWSQLCQEIKRRAALDEVALTERLKECQARLRESTADLIDRKAWLGQKRRVQLREQQALNGWAQLQRRIGKGTGRRAPALQAQARKQLVQAQGAVPVWIMPLSRVAEAVDPVHGRFDVVIIDEASQCDVNGLLAWYLADQVVVVGDDKQVSPMAVGQKLDWVQGLINQYLHDVPNHQLYDGKTSLYDLAQQAFGGTIRLREHFRCMPDIIEFSNELSYDFEIEPLRNPDAVRRPHVVEHVVSGALRDGKTNVAEAENIAGLIAAVLERPEYHDKSIGAISLLGDEQAHLIFSKTILLAEPNKLQERQFLAGNSAQFQGDQRHLIFLSMVDGPGEGPLSMRQEDYLKQRYNVAASRARDQMWLVHSLDPSRDLKPGDVRRHLIEYVRAPGARGAAAKKAMKRAESPFEAEVIAHLVAAGFAVEPQVKVGSYRIDMVVRGKGGQVAVECDGARWHPPEKIPEDLARQAILERCGWRFVRIRSTAYFTDPDKAIAKAFEQIRALGLEPDGFNQPTATPSLDPLIRDIRRRAWEIMRDRGWVSATSPGEFAESVVDGQAPDTFQSEDPFAIEGNETANG